MTGEHSGRPEVKDPRFKAHLGDLRDGLHALRKVHTDIPLTHEYAPIDRQCLIAIRLQMQCEGAEDCVVHRIMCLKDCTQQSRRTDLGSSRDTDERSKLCGRRERFSSACSTVTVARLR